MADTGAEDGHSDTSFAATFAAAAEAPYEGLEEEEEGEGEGEEDDDDVVEVEGGGVDLVENEEHASLAHPLHEDRPEIYNRVEELRSVLLDTSRVLDPYREELIYNAITGVGRLCLTTHVIGGFENSVSSTSTSAPGSPSASRVHPTVLSCARVGPIII